MPDKLYIGNFSQGQTTNRLPFNIDNDAFPVMYNFYSWRGRAKRKRGTVLLGQLQRQLQSSGSPNNWQVGTIGTLDGSGNLTVNLISHFSLQSTSTFAANSFTLTDGTNTYTEPTTADGTLVGSPAGSGTINYSTGVLTISGGAPGGTLTGTFSYYPSVPVMGLEDYQQSPSDQYPYLLAFDTKYAYQLRQTSLVNNFYSVSYYKKSNNPVSWSGQDYQLFWATNYQGAFWATNNNPGMQFLTVLSFVVGNPTTVNTGVAHGLVTGDYVWFNEITGADANLLNDTTQQITVTSPTQFTVPVNTTGKVLNNTGIFQTLTAKSPTAVGDGIRFYDGDMTSGTGLPLANTSGWVNFAPPLTATNVSINDETPALYYLCGALAIVPYKDRLVFFGPYIQTSTGQPILLEDVALWSWNGTPYYANVVPTGQTYNTQAYYVDQTGYGGWIAAGYSQAIKTISTNEDVLLVGFNGRQARFVYSGNDLYPFLFFSINAELGSGSTFSSITLDRGEVSIGTRGIIITSQQSAQRIDLQIPNNVFQIKGNFNGLERVNAARDFEKEWIYFSYPSVGSQWKYPTQTFLWNYREETWAILSENFTAHGSFYSQTGFTWATCPFSTWNTWNESWNSGSSQSLYPNVIGGNPQGYVLIKGQGTAEGLSGSIIAISQSGSYTQITSNNHCLQTGDYIYVQNCLGTVSTSINNIVFEIAQIIDANNFVINLPYVSNTYLGLGRFARLSVPFLQTKQFPVYWDQGRKVRLGNQKYLLDKTYNSQITLYIYLSQDPDDAWNNSPIVPSPESTNNTLIYSTVVYTCPENENIFLTPSNINLQMPTANSQRQIWHRMNTSLIGDAVQLGFTLSRDQMLNYTYATAEITLHSIVLDVAPAGMLS